MIARGAQLRPHAAEGLERCHELADVREAELDGLLEAARDEEHEPLRHVGTQRRHVRRARLEDERAELREALGEERHAPGQQLEQDDAERPDVGATIDVARAPDLLRGHVVR